MMRIQGPRFPFVAGLVAVLLAVPASSRSDTNASKVAPAKEAIKWRSIVSGNAEAKKSGKPALYFFTAAWCHPCRLLEGQVFAVPETAAQIEKDFVPIEVEDRMRETGRNSPEMLALADRYRLAGVSDARRVAPGTRGERDARGLAGQGSGRRLPEDCEEALPRSREEAALR